MKNRIGIFSLFLAFLLLCGCAVQASAPNTSIFGEILLDGENTTVKSLRAGMTLEEVLKVQGLTKSDVEIKEYNDINTNVPCMQVSTKESISYDELKEYGLFKMFYFEHGLLKSMMFTRNFDGYAFDEAFSAAQVFVDAVVAGSGATPLENGLGFEYMEHGSLDELEIAGAYMIQFVHAGVLSSVSVFCQNTAESDLFVNDLLISIGVSIDFDGHTH